MFSYKNWGSRKKGYPTCIQRKNKENFVSFLPYNYISSPGSLFPLLSKNPCISWLLPYLWRRKWQPTPAFLPEESRGQRSLASYSPWGCKSEHNLATKPPPPPPSPRSPTNWHLPSTSTRLASGAAAAADLQHPLEGAQGGEQEQGPLCSGETGWTGVQVARYFQELIL